MEKAEFVAIDWGTSSFRLWVLDNAGAVQATETCGKGMAHLSPGDFPVLLEETLSRLGVPRGIPTIICGMAGAAQGWVEAPYLSIEADLSELALAAVRAPGAARDVFILPGLRQAEPPNVMRGEETQISGFLAAHPGFSGVVCLPGTHAKWVRLRHGRVERFTTAMTGELFGMFAGHSVLRHCLSSGGWEDAAFMEAVSKVLGNPALAATEVFEIRARALICGHAPARARAVLSGTLVGWELAATIDYWQGQDVQIIGAPDLAERYAKALGVAGIGTTQHDATNLTLVGLRTAGTGLIGTCA